jgi:hypothetical protein
LWYENCDFINDKVSLSLEVLVMKTIIVKYIIIISGCFTLLAAIADASTYYGYTKAWYSVDGDFHQDSGIDSAYLSSYPTPPVIITCNPQYPDYQCDNAKAWSKIESTTDTIKTYAHAFGDGSFSGPLGFWEATSAGSLGYLASLYYIDPGTSGLSTGDPVELDFAMQMNGHISSSLESGWYSGNTYYSAIQAFIVSDPNGFSQSVLDQRPDIYLPFNWGEGEGGVGSIIPAPITDDNGNVIATSLVLGTAGYPSSLPQQLNPDINLSWSQSNVGVHAGDYIFVERFGYINTAILHSFSPVTYPASNSSTLDFGNSTTSTIDFSSGYSGLQLTKVPLQGANLPVVPEPASSILFITGAGILGYRRLLRHKPGNTS